MLWEKTLTTLRGSRNRWLRGWKAIEIPMMATTTGSTPLSPFFTLIHQPRRY